MRAESGMVLAKREERDVGWIDLRFRKVIERFCLACGVGMRMSMVIARWSEIVTLELDRLLIMMPVMQTRSSVCPFLWIVKSTFWLKMIMMSKCSSEVLESSRN